MPLLSPTASSVYGDEAGRLSPRTFPKAILGGWVQVYYSQGVCLSWARIIVLSNLVFSLPVIIPRRDGEDIQLRDVAE